MKLERSQYKMIAKKTESNAKLFLKQAAISADYLTNDPHWDKFLSYLQKELDSWNERSKSYELGLLNRNTVNYEKILEMKMGYLESKTAIGVLEGVMAFPRKIMDENKRIDESDSDRLS